MKKIEPNLREQIHISLANYMSLNRFADAKKLLDKYEDIDVTYFEGDEGKYFNFAIRYHNSEVLEILLDRFEKTKIEDNSLSIKSIHARYQLRESLSDSLEQFGSNAKIDKLISKYLPPVEQEDDSEQDLTGFEENITVLDKFDCISEEPYSTSILSASGDIPHEVY